MLDIGAGELLALAVIALLVLGPEKLPRYAADAARMLRQVRRMANDAREEVTKELPELGGLQLNDINPRALVKKHVLDGLDLDLGLDDDTPRSTNGATSSSTTNGATSRANGTAHRSAGTGSAPAANRVQATTSGAEPAPEVPRPAYDPDTT